MKPKLSSILSPLLVALSLSTVIALAGAETETSEETEETEETTPVVQVTKKIIDVPTVDLTKSLRVNEIGIAMGTPGGLNIVLGQWGTGETPILTRMSGMYWGEKAKGAQVDVGWVFDHEGVFKQFLSATAVYTSAKHPERGESISLYGFGPSYGFNLLGFSLQAGAAVGRAIVEASNKPRREYPVTLIAQVGYSLLF